MNGEHAEAVDLQELARRIDAPPLSIPDDPNEHHLEDAVIELRRHCLARAHRQADVKLKSPQVGTTARLPCGSRVPLGYERDLDVSTLEAVAGLDYEVPQGWRSTRVLCRSGQAALSCLLHLAMSTAKGEGRLRTHHAGRYFETKSLLELWPQALLPRMDTHTDEVDLLIGEPVHCDGSFDVTKPPALPLVRHALLLDTTLSGPAVDLAPWFARHVGPIAAVFRSGLKLDQAGLELANVGVVQLFVRSDSDTNIDSLADELRNVRALTGAGITLDELLALSVPWFLDSEYFKLYSARIFNNNMALAKAIGTDSPLFDSRCHPCLVLAGATAPFCAIRLRHGGPEEHRRLLTRIDAEVERRGIVATKGGSFGFRGIRYELIEPALSDGTPFLRVAMGYRRGKNCARMVELLNEFAQRRIY